VEGVSLNNNLLRTLREEVFLPLTNLKSLHLHGNPWSCDCRLKSFRDWVSEPCILDELQVASDARESYSARAPFMLFSPAQVVESGLATYPTACHEPERLSQKLWVDVAPEEFACKPEIR